jgi:hypothetical protein
MSEYTKAEMLDHLRGRGFYNEERDSPCDEVRRRPTSNGAYQLWRQCTTCGVPVGSAVKRDGQVHRDWDCATYVHYHAQIKAAREAELEQDRAEYAEYLQTPEWRAKADAVLARANYVCEGCGVRRPTQVHHLTYQNIFEEFLFELVAVCPQCHQRIHRRRAA